MTIAKSKEFPIVKCKLEVNIINPNIEKSMESNLFHQFDCMFSFDENQYGDGHFLIIETKDDVSEKVYYLRYDKPFARNNTAKWLANWAYDYWNGENGAWKIKSLKITETDAILSEKEFKICK